MLLNIKIPRLVRFAIVGTINTVVDLGVLNILIYIFGLTQPYIFPLYKGISFTCAFMNSYFMNKNFTFKDRKKRKYNFYSFTFFSLISLLINVLSSSFLFYLLSSNYIFLNTHPIATLSGIFGAILGLFINYLSYNYLVFK